MKKPLVYLAATLALLTPGIFTRNASAAGQIVTQEEREWAKKMVETEKSLADSPEKNSLAVLYFQNLTGRSELNSLEKGMALMLLTDLSQVPELRIIERIKLQALAEELKLGSSGLVAAKSAPRVGRLAGAEWIVGGDFTGKKKTFTTKSRLLDVTSAKIADQFSVPGTYEEIIKTEKELVFTIVKKLNISLQPEVSAAISRPCSTNLKALDALFRGVDASDRGDYKKAESLYNEALAADPDVCVAASALQELLKMDGYAKRSTSMGSKARAVAAAKAETAQKDSAKTDSSKETSTGKKDPDVESFAPASALAETALSVSGTASMTSQFATKNLNPLAQESATTPVTIRVLFQ